MLVLVPAVVCDAADHVDATPTTLDPHLTTAASTVLHAWGFPVPGPPVDVTSMCSSRATAPPQASTVASCSVSKLPTSNGQGPQPLTQSDARLTSSSDSASASTTSASASSCGASASSSSFDATQPGSNPHTATDHGPAVVLRARLAQAHEHFPHLLEVGPARGGLVRGAAHARLRRSPQLLHHSVQGGLRLRVVLRRVWPRVGLERRSRPRLRLQPLVSCPRAPRRRRTPLLRRGNRVPDHVVALPAPCTAHPTSRRIRPRPRQGAKSGRLEAVLGGRRSRHRLAVLAARPPRHVQSGVAARETHRISLPLRGRRPRLPSQSRRRLRRPRRQMLRVVSRASSTEAETPAIVAEPPAVMAA